MNKNRRDFIKVSGQAAIALGLTGMASLPMIGCTGKPKNESAVEEENTSIVAEPELWFTISLAQWSLNRQLFGGEIDNLDFASVAKNKFDINAVEYVNQFFPNKATDMDYLGEMKKRTDDLGMRNVLIMIDREGDLGDIDDAKRMEAVENHYKWVEAAKFLGCHSIRVNARSGSGDPEEAKLAAIDGLGKLTEFGAQHDIGIIVENHGGFSSDGQWLSSVISQVGNDMCGTLPDLGNFCIKRSENEERERTCINEYDRYQGTKELMPFAKGVSAKTYNFDAEGNEKDMDYTKLLSIVKEAGFNGFIGIEYEGPGDAYEGIKATKDLLVKVGKELA